MNTEQTTKSKSASYKVISVIGIILCIVFSFILASNFVIIIKGMIYPDVPPSVFGVMPMVVSSGSMSGNAADDFDVGDLILIGKVEPQNLKEGDVISFREGNSIVTHRIKTVNYDESGNLLFTTKGDANNVEDANPVKADT